MKNPINPETEVMKRIVERAVRMYLNEGINYEALSVWMDLTYTHKQYPLRLAALLHSDDMNFAHDIFGMRKHMNREACELENCFVPRYAA